MLAPLLAILAVGAGVAIHVDDARGVSPDEAATLTTELQGVLRTRSGQRVALDEERTAPCTASDRCVGEIRTRTDAGDVILVTLLGVPTRIRMVAERFRGGQSASAEHVELDLDRRQGDWHTQLVGAVARLFPESIVTAAVGGDRGRLASEPDPGDEVAPGVTDLRAPAPQPRDGPSVAPWVAIGAGAVALAVGIGFGLDSRAARNSAATQPHSPAEIDDLRSRAIGHGIVADVMFGLSVVGVGTGLALLVF